MKKPILKSLCLMFCFALFAISCSKNESVDNPNAKVSKQQRLKQAAKLATQARSHTPSTSDEDYDSECIASFDCFEFVFPLTVNDGNGNDTVVNDDDELYEFYESLDEDSDPQFTFPIQIQFEDEAPQTITNEDELEEAYDECFDEDDCFTLNFPLTVVDNNGNETVVNSEAELDNLYDTLAEDGFIDFVYPITITLTDGNEVEIEDDEAFDEVYSNCYDFDDYDDFEDFDCFEIQFPITVQTSNGDLTIADEDELEAYFMSLEEDEDPQFNFPITIVYEDGSTHEITSNDELEEAFDDCFYDEEGEAAFCFDITYPLNLIGDNDVVTTVNNDQEFDAYIDALGEDDYFDITYPLTVLLEDGSTQTINDDDAFIDLVSSCF